MRGRRGKRGRSKTSERKYSPAPTEDKESSSPNSAGPLPSSKRKRRQSSSDSFGFDSSGGDEDNTDGREEGADDFQPSAWTPQCGVSCKRHRKQFRGRSDMLTLYSHFPGDRQRLAVGNLLCTLLVYVMIFPVINCIWTYYVVTDEELVNLFTYITANPRTSFRSHVSQLSWLKLPSLNAESISLLLAIALKNAAAPLLQHSGGNLNFSLRDVLLGEMARRYRN